MYLVVGANGFLGSYMLKNILESTGDKVVAIARSSEKVTESPRIKWVSCDISHMEEVDEICNMVSEEDNLKVIFLAAYHNPDLVEKNPRLAWNVNITSLSYFMNKLQNVKCLFYPSTDSVYGNSVNSYHYKEEDALNPVNTYGKQKAAAESIVMWYGYNVVRYPFLIAPSLSPCKKHFYDKVVEALTNGKTIEMFTDSYRSSMSFDTAAALLIRLMENYNEDIPKALNICGDDDLSKYDIGLMLADKLHVSRDLVIPIRTDQSQGIFEAKRAKSTLMDNSKLKKILGIEQIKLYL